jgi:hypothetical protein
MMTDVSADAVLAMNREQAWSHLRDLTLAQYYVPGVTRIEITTPQREGMGASRTAFCKGRKPVDETVVRWEEGWGFTVRLHHGDKPPTPFRRAEFTYWLEDAANGQTRIRTTMSYEPPLGILGRFLERVFLRRMMISAVRTIVSGLKHVYETGTSANPLVAGAVISIPNDGA